MDIPDYIQNQIDSIKNKISESEALLNESSNLDIKLLAQEEIESLKKQIIELNLAIASGEDNYEENDTESSKKKFNNCIMEIRAGAGGDEAGLFANNLYTMYTRYAERMKWKVEEISKNDGGIGNIKEVVFEIISNSNKRPYELLKHESGVHRVQRVPTTESSGRIHTSTATIAVLPIVDEVEELEIRPEELRIDTYRAGGAGGQHVNKTESAIRITHLPTGTVVQCQDERSQHKNKERAMSVLKSKLFQMMQEQQAGKIGELRANQVGSAERSEKIRTYNFPQDRITDHRIKKNWHNLDKILLGEIDKMLEDVSSL